MVLALGHPVPNQPPTKLMTPLALGLLKEESAPLELQGESNHLAGQMRCAVRFVPSGRLC